MKSILLSLSLLFIANVSFADPGIINKTSVNSVKETVDKLETIVSNKGFTVVARVNHSKAAEKNGLSLRPTEVLIFGNPKVGTKLMNSNQAIGLDLPIKVLVWEDEKGMVNMSYNDPAWMVSRYGISDREGVVKKMTGALGKFTDAAAK